VCHRWLKNMDVQPAATAEDLSALIRDCVGFGTPREQCTEAFDPDGVLQSRQALQHAHDVGTHIAAYSSGSGSSPAPTSSTSTISTISKKAFLSRRSTTYILVIVGVIILLIILAVVHFTMLTPTL
jgi:hypothetical protein